MHIFWVLRRILKNLDAQIKQIKLKRVYKWDKRGTQMEGSI
jgi:hypothetical protein